MFENAHTFLYGTKRILKYQQPAIIVTFLGKQSVCPVCTVATLTANNVDPLSVLSCYFCVCLVFLCCRQQPRWQIDIVS